MTEAGWTGCGDCGMPCASSEYHPYAACLMFKHCRNSETVRANLQAVRQQGRVAGIMEAEREMYRLEERTSTNCAQDLLDFYRWCAQQAQEGGVGE